MGLIDIFAKAIWPIQSLWKYGYESMKAIYEAIKYKNIKHSSNDRTRADLIRGLLVYM